MSARRFYWVVVGVPGLVLSLAMSQAVPSEVLNQRTRAAKSLVESALQSEIAGSESERSSQLESALEESPSFAPAQWQTGHVEWRHHWVKFDEFPAVASDRRLTTYRSIRDRYPATAAGQLALAKWCGANQLDAQERAHLTQVLAYNPNNQEARRLLGDRSVNGTWVSAEDQEQLATRATEQAAARKQWEGKIRKLCADLSSAACCGRVLHGSTWPTFTTRQRFRPSMRSSSIADRTRHRWP